MGGINLFYLFLAASLGGIIFAVGNLATALAKGEPFRWPKFVITVIAAIGSGAAVAAASTALPSNTDLWVALLGAFSSGIGGAAGTKTVVGLAQTY